MKAGEKDSLFQSKAGYGSMTNGRGSTNTNGSTVSFHNIDYVVEVKEDGEKVIKNILHEVSGYFSPGMNAIMGPTGSGKTSLLDVLAARKDRRGLRGVVLVDGQSQPIDFKLMSGYVVQDDVVMGTLTVRENLAFSANLRLPRSVGSRGKAERVDDVISELGLTSCADTKIGDAFVRGVSGGERKRTNIGMELIIKPNILFLDEPTTGLDASTANSVMLLLSRLSQQGRCIIFSIHQPRYSIFRLFDKLHLLCLGETMYHGPADQALEHFSSLGYVCDEHNNPADFFLDILNEDSTAVQNVTETAAEAQENKKDLERSFVGLGGKTGDLKATLKAHYKKSVCCSDVEKNLGRFIESYREIDAPVAHQTVYPTSTFYQFLYLSQRNARNILRNPRISTGQLLVTLFYAVLVGIIFLQVDDTATAGVQNRIGAFFFIATNTLFSNTSAVEPFISERVIFLHESASGFYRVSSYFLAKIMADFIPARTIPTILFAVIIYWMIGFKSDTEAFFIFLLNLLLTTYAACALAFYVGACTRNIALANLAMALAYILMVIFGGLLVNIDSMGDWLNWIQYLSLARYCVNTLYIVEFKNQTFCDKRENFYTKPSCVDGNEFLESQGVDYTDWGLWQNQIALIIFTFGFLVFAYLKLKMIPKMK